MRNQAVEPHKIVRVASRMTSDLKQVVKQKYGEAAMRVRSAAQKSRCETPGCQSKGEPVTPSFYR